MKSQTRLSVRSINQSNCSISVRLSFLFCSRAFISRSYENRSKYKENLIPPNQGWRRTKAETGQPRLGEGANVEVAGVRGRAARPGCLLVRDISPCTLGTALPLSHLSRIQKPIYSQVQSPIAIPCHAFSSCECFRCLLEISTRPY